MDEQTEGKAGYMFLFRKIENLEAALMFLAEELENIDLVWEKTLVKGATPATTSGDTTKEVKGE